MKAVSILPLAFSLLLWGCSAPPATQLPSVTEMEAVSNELTATATELASLVESVRTATETLEVQVPTPTTTVVEDDEVVQAGVNGIILFIGDGMGVGQRTAARWLAAGQDGLLAMDQMEVAGLAQTAAYQRPVTDSAAGATAMSSGVQTRYGVVGLDKDYEPVITILEQAEALGWSTGLVTTVQMAHATPASFAAHVADRANMLEIARQYLVADVDVLMGGGEDEFLPGGERGCYPEPGERGDGSNLVAQAQELGYRYICTAEELSSLDVANTPKLLGLFGDEEMVRPFSPSLTEMTIKAVEILSQNPNGFFLMVEGGQIDWAGHANDAAWAMETTLGFDSAVAYGQAYAAIDGNVLVIVAADHETGGMSVGLTPDGTFRQEGPFTGADGQEFYVDWQTGSHTAVDIPINAQGPYANMLEGTYHLAHIYEVMYAALMGK
ncbi:MAG: alkaline phosphatase [Chloroflexi bacterium]|nr:MAG: alkaline phosphatase [Chloroflexota bacterium]MBL1194041.1 alkaline phosphatase [Chloroflexota bacterium]NOH11335.1 alkaline phosphatase [Chloroflexota bacterium]